MSGERLRQAAYDVVFEYDQQAPRELATAIDALRAALTEAPPSESTEDESLVEYFRPVVDRIFERAATKTTPPSESLDSAARRVAEAADALDHFATWSALNRPEVAPLREALAVWRAARLTESGK